MTFVKKEDEVVQKQKFSNKMKFLKKLTFFKDSDVDNIFFAKMMNGPVMKRMDDYHEILGSKFLNDSILSNSAVFVFYNPNPALKSSSFDSHDNNNSSLSSSLNDTNNTNQNEEGQVNLLKAAREYQATNLFIHLETNEKNEE